MQNIIVMGVTATIKIELKLCICVPPQTKARSPHVQEWFFTQDSVGCLFQPTLIHVSSPPTTQYMSILATPRS